MRTFVGYYLLNSLAVHKFVPIVRYHLYFAN